jgi:hypothetical protein
VARATTTLKRAVLRVILGEHERASTPLKDLLHAGLTGHVEQARNGSPIMVGTSAGGASASFAIPQGVHLLSEVELAELFSELIDLYEQAIQGIEGTPTDTTVGAAMLGQLNPVRAFRADFRSLER